MSFIELLIEQLRSEAAIKVAFDQLMIEDPERRSRTIVFWSERLIEAENRLTIDFMADATMEADEFGVDDTKPFDSEEPVVRMIRGKITHVWRSDAGTLVPVLDVFEPGRYIMLGMHKNGDGIAVIADAAGSFFED